MRNGVIKGVQSLLFNNEDAIVIQNCRHALQQLFLHSSYVETRKIYEVDHEKTTICFGKRYFLRSTLMLQFQIAVIGVVIVRTHMN